MAADSRGIALTLLSAIVWSLHALGTKISTEVVSPWILCFVTSTLYLPYLFLIRWEYSERYSLSDGLLILFAGLSSSGNLCFGTLGFSLTAIGNASAIIYTKPIICLILDKVFLREKLVISDVCLTISNFIGVVLISKPQFIFGYNAANGGGVVDMNLWGSLAAFLAALCGAISYLFVRKLIERDVYDPALFMVANGVVGYVLYGVLTYTSMTAHDHMKTPSDWIVVVLTGLAATTALSLVSLALKSQSSSVTALVGTAEVPASYLLQVLFTDNKLEPTMVVGALLIIAAPVWYSVKGMIQDYIEKENDIND